MATVTLYVGSDPAERKRRRGKILAAVLLGAVGATIAASRAKPPAAPSPGNVAVKVTLNVGPPALTTAPPVTATVVETPPPPLPARAIVAPARIDFGSAELPRATAAQLATIRNDGGQPVARVDASVSGPFVATNGCRGALQPGSECVVAVVFTPREPGRFAGALAIVADGQRSVVPLAGSVPRPREVPPAPTPVPPPVIVTETVAPPRPQEPPARQLCFDPPRLHFTSTGKQAITLTNPENTPLRVVEVRALGRQGDAVSGYQVEARRCIRTLRPGERCSFTVAATELALQTRESMRLEVTYEDPATGRRRAARAASACAPAGR